MEPAACHVVYMDSRVLHDRYEGARVEDDLLVPSDNPQFQEIEPPQITNNIKTLLSVFHKGKQYFLQAREPIPAPYS